MKITALQLIEQAERKNRNNFREAMALLEFFTQLHEWPDGPTKTDAMANFVERARAHLKTNREWENAEIEIEPVTAK